ncbi:PREDICTED: odorant receptor 13a-like [Vollenhovia emeryi]|uniref:odorant receptor 13a-like n=1 Tax=Vollenhovia emeryi TaxID=411798 RepID=UPI0005F38DE0|nr:PREDICTED: odorant receptor 13a-like [Vollenhovia emeryi]
MTDKKDIWKSRYYLILRTYMTISGIWPYRRPRDRYMHFIPTFIFSSSILIPQLLYVFVASELNDVIESLMAAIISIIFSLKVANIMFNKNIKSCLKTIEEDWLSLKTDVEISILQRHAEHGRYLTTSYAVFMHMIQVFYLVKPVLLTLLETDIANSTKASISKLPFRVEYGVDVDRYFYPITIHCYLAVFAHVFSTVAVDGLYCTLIQHACGMFSIVGHVLEEIGKNNDAKSRLTLNKIENNDYKKALNCLRRHLQVIEFAELIESTFTNVFLISVNLNMIGGSVTGIQMVMNLNKGVREAAAPMAIYIAQLVHIFLQFWQAQFLLDYSIVPCESICRGKWYYTSRRCQRLFLLIMTRTVSPCRITAGKIVTLSIESFGTVLKTMMSYFTVLRSFQ